ncbi:MAG: M20/M25/M40 family metallo-hydrolase [Anaerolineales bacterium]|nr:M20/M25/M40 family metallo-hydrolase [Anaerolineales bacterium]
MSVHKHTPQPIDPAQAPHIAEAQIQLLERLCNACAVSGYEHEVRAIVLEQIQPYVTDLKVDAMGNVLALRQGSDANRLRVMVAAHMDEVGLMVIGKDGNGLFRFEAIGGVQAAQLAGKPVWVGREHIPGVIGISLSFLEDEQQRAPSIEALHLDVGPENAEKVKPGDWATFASAFARLGPSLRAKALDDRLGVASLIELVKNAPPNVDLLAAFTVQEEVGLRGAGVAAYALEPHLAIVLDCTPAVDLPVLENLGEGAENARYNTRLGNGPAIYVADGVTISDPRLIRHLVKTAEALGIAFQFRQPGGGGTDAGAIHRQRTGIPSVSVSVPGRYLHTAATMVRLDDWKNSLALVYGALANLSPGVLATAR